MSRRILGIHYATSAAFVFTAALCYILNFVPFGEDRYLGFPIRERVNSKDAAIGMAFEFVSVNGPVCLLLTIAIPILIQCSINRLSRSGDEKAPTSSSSED